MRIHFNTINSTSTYIKDHYKELKHLTFVDASFQSEGRGRMGRSWIGNKDTLMFSYLIKEKSLVEQFSSLSILAATSVIKSLERIGLNDVTLKWPNDVYISGQKVAGILLEGISLDNELTCVVIGIGVNVLTRVFPSDLLHKATSIKLNNIDISVSKYRRLLYRIIKDDIATFNKGDRSYLSFANSHHFLLNKRVFAEVLGKKEEILALEINKDNSLKIKKDGVIKSIFSSEITFH